MKNPRAIRLIVLSAVVSMLLCGCGSLKLAERYGAPFSLGEGQDYRSFVFEVDLPRADPYPVKINDFYAYTISLQAEHVEQITDAVFEAAKLFTEDFGAVKVDGKWGYIRIFSPDEQTFEYVIPPSYEGAEPFSEGLAAVMLGGKYGYINKDGEMLIAPVFDSAYYFSSGLAAVSDATGYYFIDTTGSTVIPGPFDEAESFYSDLAPVRIGDKWGYINIRGQIVVEPIYDDAWSFDYNGHAAVEKDGKWSYLNIGDI